MAFEVPPHQKVAVSAFHLKGDAKQVLWMHPEFVQGSPENWRQTLWNQNGFIIPTNAEDWSLIDRNQAAEWAATRYGGDGLGANEGDGRAAIGPNSPYQNKGLGKIKLLVHETEDHASGLMHLEFAINEILWGEILHRLLPYGANRVVAIIARGTFSPNSKGEMVPDVIVVRENSLRPAHFMLLRDARERNGWFKESPRELRQAFSRFVEATTDPEKPLPENKSRWDDFNASMNTLSDRMARQMAALYAYQFHAGSPTPSNIEISGRILDYGSMVSQKGLGQIQTHPTFAPAGDIFEIKNLLVLSVAKEMFVRFNSILKTPENKFKSYLMELDNRFENEYRKYIRQTLLHRAGFSDSDIESLAATLEGKLLGETLFKIASFGAKNIPANTQPPEPSSQFDLELVLETYLNTKISNDDETALTEVLPPLFLRAELEANFTAAVNVLSGSQSKRKYRNLLTNLLDRKVDVEPLQRQNRGPAIRNVVAEFKAHTDPEVIGQFITESVEQILGPKRRSREKNCRFFLTPSVR